MNEHEKYLFLHGAMRGLKSRLQHLLKDDDRVVFDAAELQEMLETIDAVLNSVGGPP